MNIDFVFQIAILIMSVVIHEVSHGYAARAYGDRTAEWEGRLTLNPIKHLDPFGSVLVPALSYFLGGFIFGWAKPVPYNPHNLKPGRWPEAFVALAGPLSNIVIALIGGIAIRFFPIVSEVKLQLTVAALSPSVSLSQVATSQTELFFGAIVIIVFINILLAVFNLLPIPPLDGSKLLFALFPEKLYRMRGVFEQFGLILVILFIFFAWQVIYPIVRSLFILITGLSL